MTHAYPGDPLAEITDWRDAAERCGFPTKQRAGGGFNVRSDVCHPGGDNPQDVWVALSETRYPQARCHKCPFPESDANFRRNVGLPEFRSRGTSSAGQPSQRAAAPPGPSSTDATAPDPPFYDPRDPLYAPANLVATYRHTSGLERPVYRRDCGGPDCPVSKCDGSVRKHIRSEGFASFLTLVGLTVSGRAQSYPGTITLIHGRARTGKGGIVRLVLGALGERGFQVKPEWLDPRKRGDTDATLWLIIFRQPLMIAIDEIGNTQEVSLLRLLDLTGDNQQSARRPFGKEPITGTILCAIWTTAVKSPRLATGTGLGGGRLAALQTVRSTPIPEEHRKVGYEQDLLDAVITLGCMEAKGVYEPGYKGPTRDETAYATAVQDMDPVAAWLEALSGEWHGRLVVEALEQCRADTDDPDITDTLFGRRIGVSGRWDKMKPTGRGDSRRVLRLRDDAPLVGVGRKPDPLTRICAMPDCDQPVGPDGQFCTDCGGMGQGRVALGRPSPVRPALRRIAAEGVAILEAEGVETDLIEEAVAVLASWDSNAELLRRIRLDVDLELSLPTQNAERAASPKIAVLTETMERVMDNLVNGATLGAETPDQLLNGKLQRWWEQLTEVVAEAPAGQQEEVGDGDDAE